MIYIASDHGGFKLKSHLGKFLNKIERDFKDLGPKKFVNGDDYPDYAILVAKKISQKPNQDLGILICRSGQGVCIVANKFKHVRAALVWNVKEAKMSRTDDMTNVLCLPADYVSTKMAEQIVKTWLKTSYSKNPRHLRRVNKISKLDR